MFFLEHSVHFSPYLTHVTTLLKGVCSKFLPNTGFITIRWVRFSVKVKRHTIATIFLLRGYCQICAGCPEMIFYVPTGGHPVVAFLTEQDRK